MRRVLLLGTGLGFLALTATLLVAQSSKTPPSPTQKAPDASSESFAAAPRSAIDPNDRALDAMRQRFIELSKQKATVMSDGELKQEIEKMEGRLRDIEGWTKIDKAVQLLHDVVEKNANTKAAEAAKVAIQVILEQRKSNATTFDSPRPVADDAFAAPSDRPAERSEKSPPPFGADGTQRFDIPQKDSRR